ncbi:MAG: glycosyltransferase [Clostridia bacterium]|nr:glycosyltransferase [Clostridia bacterium]
MIITEKKTLMVIIRDKLSSLVKKGEITERYYNPGNLFNEVHIVMTSDDKVNIDDVQKTVGEAKLYIHNIELKNEKYASTLGFHTGYLSKWAQKGIELAKQISPSLIRCHGNYVNTYLAYKIKQALNIPYIVSLHTNPDEAVIVLKDFRRGIFNKLLDPLSKTVLKNADLVIPVYESIIPYLERLRVSNYEIIYNMINPSNLVKKDTYSLSSPVKIISVGRQLKGKDISNLIKALRGLNNVTLKVVGDGPLHNHLLNIAKEYKVDDKISFSKCIANDMLCRELAEYDIFCTHTDYYEMPKAILEPLLTGLPVILNRRKGKPVPEYKESFIYLTDNTEIGYRDAIQRLIDDEKLRSSLGICAFLHSSENWSPDKVEAKLIDTYSKIVGRCL